MSESGPSKTDLIIVASIDWIQIHENPMKLEPNLHNLKYS